MFRALNNGTQAHIEDSVVVSGTNRPNATPGVAGFKQRERALRRAVPSGETAFGLFF